MRDIQREKQRHRQREKQAPCREPDSGLNPRTPGSQPEPKADRGSTTEPPWDPRLYAFMRDRERERQGHRQREKQAPRREPEAGLDPGSPGSRWAEGGATPLRRRGCPEEWIFKATCGVLSPTSTGLAPVPCRALGQRV